MDTHSKDSPKSVLNDSQTLVWEIQVLKGDIPDPLVEKLRQNLNEISQFSAAYLKSRGVAIEAQHVPANLFYPHYGPQGKEDGAAFWLAMNSRLATAYSGANGFHIAPGAGATGSVFKSGKDAVYEGGTNLDQTFAEVHITESIEWVVSTAIRRGDQVVAILNVDVRDVRNVPFNVMNDLQAALKKSQQFKGICDTVASLPLVTLKIKVE
jgi:hypothetical protein